MKTIMLIALLSSFPCSWCQEHFTKCKRGCEHLQGIEWSLCVDECMKNDRRCRRRCEP